MGKYNIVNRSVEYIRRINAEIMIILTCPEPVSVPPVPTPPTRISILPSVCHHNSGPVVSLCSIYLSEQRQESAKDEMMRTKKKKQSRVEYPPTTSVDSINQI